LSTIRNNRDSYLIPEEAELLISLVEKIILQHTEAGINSPISNSLIADINYRIREARSKHDQGEKYRKLMEAAFHDRDIHLGISRREDKLRSIVHEIVSLLDAYYDEQPEELKKWGVRV